MGVEGVDVLGPVAVVGEACVVEIVLVFGVRVPWCTGDSLPVDCIAFDVLYHGADPYGSEAHVLDVYNF